MAAPTTAAPPAGGAKPVPISGIPNLDNAAINLNALREFAKLELVRVLDSVGCPSLPFLSLFPPPFTPIQSK